MDLMPVTNVVVLEQEAALHVMQEKLMPVGRVAEHACCIASDSTDACRMSDDHVDNAACD